MSIGPKVLFPCDHTVVSKATEYGNISIKRSYNELNLDKVPVNTEILRIDRVFDAENREYFNGINYNQNINSNIIEWVKDADKSPSFGDEYYIQCAYIRTSIVKYEQSKCERCCGNGWYADILNEGNNVELAEGIQKLTQDFMKILFTSKSDDSDYGTTLTDLIGSTENSSIVASEIVKALREAEQVIKSRHQDNIINGVSVNAEEALSTVNVEKVVFVRNEQTYYVTVRITSEASDIAKFSFKL